MIEEIEVGDIVDHYGDRAVVREVEPRRAGGPMYFIEFDCGKSWVNMNEIDLIEKGIK